ncbi:MAG TPA: DUF1801 domain-containing protein [Nitrososphaera sp.]|nr:DUF1801 domain-containing protein [Nitrososphaera sp.]
MNEATPKIDAYLAALPKWKQDPLVRFRKLIHEVEPTITEGWKWDVPVFLYGGKTIFTITAFKEHVKYNFILNGALLDDTGGLFNNGLESKKSRSIDLREGESVDQSSLRKLVEQAVQTAKK